jgi:hypothetical protein
MPGRVGRNYSRELEGQTWDETAQLVTLFLNTARDEMP